MAIDGKDTKSDVESIDSMKPLQAISGSLSSLIEEHREQINTAKVVPFIPFVLFRVGPVVTPIEQWYYALLNRDFMAQKEQLLESYRSGQSIDVVDPKILDKTLRDMLVEHVRDVDPGSVNIDYRATFETVKNTLFENDATEPRVKRPNGIAAINYNLQPPLDKESSADSMRVLGRRVGESLAYVTIHPKERPEQVYGAIAINLCYAINSKGGR